jgi:predicted RNA-binding Zn-ribbon protein involved in translation (DUF1610 family)
MAPADLDDEPLARCARHSDTTTALSCVSCGDAICVERCAVQAAVGFKCPACAQTSRAARGAVPINKLVQGLIACGAVAIVGGGVLAVVRVPFLGIILAYLLGMGVGEVARRASGGYRDVALARGAAALAALGVAALPLAGALASVGGLDGQAAAGLAFVVLGALAAAWGAYTRAV